MPRVRIPNYYNNPNDYEYYYYNYPHVFDHNGRKGPEAPDDTEAANNDQNNNNNNNNNNTAAAALLGVHTSLLCFKVALCVLLP